MPTGQARLLTATSVRSTPVTSYLCLLRGSYHLLLSRSAEFTQNHFNGIKNAVREGSRGSGSGGSGSRGSGRDVDIDVDIQHLKIEFEKNFFILIKKGN